MSRPKIRVRCIGRNTKQIQLFGCGWAGYRRGWDCECYDLNRLYCRPYMPGPGCPSSVIWPCPRCSGATSVLRLRPGRKPNTAVR